MICPRCNNNLTMSNKNGVEIDFCPNCRGIWLDKGELEKIIERENSMINQGNRFAFDDDDDDDDHHQKRHNQHPSYGDSHDNHHRKKGFLSNIFDF